MVVYQVRAVWRDGGWDLVVPGFGPARAASLGKAKRVARAMVAEQSTAQGDDEFVLELLPEVDGIEHEVREVRQEIDELASAQVRVAQRSRRVARTLREKGLTGADAAVVLGVSPQRVSQLNQA